MPQYTWIYRPILRGKQEPPSCCICHDPVSLETSKADECGQAVHEECYVQQLCSVGNGRVARQSLSRRASDRAIDQPREAVMTKVWEMPAGTRASGTGSMLVRKVNPDPRHRLPWNVDAIALVAVVALTAWIVYSGGSRPDPLAPPQESTVMGEHETLESGSGKPKLETASYAVRGAGAGGGLAQTEEGAVEYFGDDVTVRYYSSKTPLPLNNGISHVSYIGSDVTIRHFAPSASTGIPASSRSSASVSANSARSRSTK
jgi:hypothetical protein